MKLIYIAVLALLISSVPFSGWAKTPTPTPAPTKQSLSPMMVEINAAIKTAKEEIADLGARLKTATTDQQTREIQQEVQQIKYQARLETLQIQWRFAQAENRLEDCAKLETAIEKLEQHDPSEHRQQ